MAKQPESLWARRFRSIAQKYEGVQFVGVEYDAGYGQFLATAYDQEHKCIEVGVYGQSPEHALASLVETLDRTARDSDDIDDPFAHDGADHYG